MPDEKKSHPLFVATVIVLVLAVIGYGLFKYTKKEDTAVNTQENNNNNTEATTTPEVPVVTVPKSTYKDGTYTSDGMYISPGGDEKINVSLTLKDDVIVDATVKSLAVRPTSKIMQGQFIAGYKAQVVGKKLDEVTLTKVSGSSLTPKGWNDAVAKIQVQAKA